MKKLAYLFLLAFTVSFISCEPNSLSEDENNTEIYNVDRGEIEKPGSQGGGNSNGG